MMRRPRFERRGRLMELDEPPDDGREGFLPLLGDASQKRVLVIRDPQMQLPVPIHHPDPPGFEVSNRARHLRKMNATRRQGRSAARGAKLRVRMSVRG